MSKTKCMEMKKISNSTLFPQADKERDERWRKDCPNIHYIAYIRLKWKVTFACDGAQINI